MSTAKAPWLRTRAAVRDTGPAHLDGTPILPPTQVGQDWAAMHRAQSADYPSEQEHDNLPLTLADLAMSAGIVALLICPVWLGPFSVWLLGVLGIVP